MKKLTDKVEDVLRGTRDFTRDQPDVARMQQMYLHLLNQGFISRPEYELPLLDTVGCKVETPTRNRSSAEHKDTSRAT
jgi:hypothetical protein